MLFFFLLEYADSSFRKLLFVVVGSLLGINTIWEQKLVEFIDRPLTPLLTTRSNLCDISASQSDPSGASEKQNRLDIPFSKENFQPIPKDCWNLWFINSNLRFFWCYHTKNRLVENIPLSWRNFNENRWKIFVPFLTPLSHHNNDIFCWQFSVFQDMLDNNNHLGVF